MQEGAADEAASFAGAALAGSDGVVFDGALFVLVTSRVANADTRTACRRTWLSHGAKLFQPTVESDGPPDGVGWRFVIGTNNIDADAHALLNAEQAKYGDLLLLDKEEDRRSNLTPFLLAG